MSRKTSFRRKVHAWITLILFFFYTTPVPVFAEELVVPASGKTNVYNAPNGVPVVNIETANSTGLSHNKYNKFGIDSRGLVLNNGDNSLMSRKSQLAGQVMANLNLVKGQEASVILNEVVSANRTNLAGYMEVLGGKADVIVANPYGISCNGVGFINTDRATLTTGTSIIGGDGSLSGFNVNMGDVFIDGKGIDAANQNILDIVARRVKINGQINAQTLGIATGANEWSYVTREVTGSTAGSGDVPAYALDSTLLGGMYAQRIKIVATEAGVGVRMLGEAAATADDFTIDASGNVLVKNRISAERDILMTGKGLANSVEFDTTAASLSAKRNIAISADGNVSFNEASFVAGGDFSLSAAGLVDTSATNAARFAAGNTTLEISGATAINGTKWGSGGKFSLQSGSLSIGEDAATLYSGSNAEAADRRLLIATVGDMDLAAANIVSPDDIVITTQSGSLTVGSGDEQQIASGKNLSLSANTTLSNSGNLLAVDDLTVRSTNSSGSLGFSNSGRVQSGAGLDLAGYNGGTALTLTNTGTGTMLGDTLKVNSMSLTNASGGSIQGTKGSTVTVTGTLVNSGDFFVSDTSGSSATINAGALNNDGKIQGKDDLSVNITNNSGDLTNSGTLLADADLILRSTDAAGSLDFSNTGWVQAGDVLNLAGYGGGSALVLSNSETGTLLGNSLTIYSTTFTNAADATIQGTQGGTVNVSGAFSNSGAFIGSDTSGYHAVINAGTLTNSGDLLSKGKFTLNINANSLDNSGDILAASDLIVRSTNSSGTLSLTNSGWMQTGGVLDLAGYNGGNGLSLSNTGTGTLLGNTLNIYGSSFTNAAGAAIQGTQGGTLNITGALTNNGSFIGSDTSGYHAMIQAGTFANAGYLQSKGNLTLNISTNSLTNSGNLLASGGLTVRSVNSSGTLSLTNSGWMQAGSALDLAGYNGGNALSLSNTGTATLLGNTLNVKGASLTNASGAVIQGSLGSTVDLTGDLTNQGKFVASNNSSSDATFALASLNNTGEISGGHNLSFTASNQIDNTGSSAKIIAGNDLTFTGSNDIDNDGGTLQAGGTLKASAGNDLNNKTGSKMLGNVLDLSGQQLTNQGDMKAVNQAKVDTTGISNSGNLILSTATGNTSTLKAGTIANSGIVQGVGDAAITLKNSGTLTNQSGGKILVTTGGLEISSDSDTGTASVDNSGRIEGFNGINIHGNGTGRNINVTVASGSVLKGGGITIKGETVDNSGTIQNDSDSGALSFDLSTYNNNGSSSLLLNSGTNFSNLNVSGTVKNEGAVHGNGNFTITAGTLTNSSTGGLSSLKHLSLTSANDFTNDGALYAGENLSLTAMGKTITNNSTMDSDGDMDIRSATFTNYNKINASNNIAITTTAAFNNLAKVTGGVLSDITTYSAMTKEEFENPLYAYSGSNSSSLFWTADSGNVYTFYEYQNESYGFSAGCGDHCPYFDSDKRVLSLASPPAEDSTDATNPRNWSIYQYYYQDWDDDDFWSDPEHVHYYGLIRGQKKVIRKNVLSEGATISKSEIIAGGALTVNMGAGDGTNRGSILSADTLTLNGSGNFTNDALTPITETYYSKYEYQLTLAQDPGSDGAPQNSKSFRVEPTPGAAYENPTSTPVWTVKASETEARDYAVANPDKVLTETGAGIGAGVFATTLNVNIGGTLTNSGDPSAAATNSISKSGVSGTTGAGDVSSTSASSGVSGSNLNSGKSSQNLRAGIVSTTLSNGMTVVGLDLSLPTNPNGYFVVSQNPQAKYLVETNPLYAVGTDYVGSDYMAERLGLNPDTIQKRLGDANYEAQLVRKQLVANTGRNILQAGVSEEQQMKALVENGVNQAANLGLTFGQPLSPEQVASLGQDIVWMVETEVNGQKVLAPVVYLSQTTKDNIFADDAVMTAQNADLKVGSLKNDGGVVEGSTTLKVDSKKDITNTGGTIGGGNVALTTQTGSIVNTAGIIKGKDLSLDAKEGKIVNQTVARTIGGGQKTDTVFSQTASIESTGNLKLAAKGDIENTGANISAKGNADIKTEGSVLLNDLKKTTGSKSYSEIQVANVKSSTSTSQSQTTSVGSKLDIGGNLKLDAGKDLTAVGSDITVGGNADLKAKDINLLAASESSSSSTKTSTEADLFITTYKQTSESSTNTTTAKASNLKVGGNLKAETTQDITVVGSNVDVGGNADLKGRDIVISAAKETSVTTSKKSQDAGLVGSIIGGVNKSESHTVDSTTYSDAKSSIKVGGNLKADASQDLISASSDIEVGKNADLNAGRDQKFVALSDKTVTTDVKQEDKGFSFYAEFAHSDDTSSTKGQAGANVQKAGYEGKSFAAGAGIQRELETSTTVHTQTTAVASTIKAGGDVNRSAGNELLDKGTDIEAGGNYSQQAKTITNLAAENTDTTTTTTETAQMRFGVYAEGSYEQNATPAAKSAMNKAQSAGGKAIDVAGGKESGANGALSAGTAYAEAGAIGMDAYNLANSSGSTGGEAGLEVRTNVTKTTETTANTTAVVSKIKAGGNVSSMSENKTTFEGTNIDAGGNINLTAGDLEVKAARDSSSKTTDTTSHDSYVRLGGALEGSGNAGMGEKAEVSGSADVRVEAGYRYSESSASEKGTTAVAASFKSGGGLNVKTTNDATFEGTQIDAQKGASVDAGGNVNFNAAEDTTTVDNESWSVGGYARATFGAAGQAKADGKSEGGYGFGGAGGVSAAYANTDNSSSTAKAATINTGSGGLTIKSGKDVTLEGVDAKGQGALDVNAKGNVNITAATSETEVNDVSVSARADAAFGSGKKDVDLAAGVKGEKSSETKEEGAKLSFGSGVNIASGKDLTMVGTEVKTDGQVNLAAKGNVDLKAAENDSNSLKGQASADLKVTDLKSSSLEATGEIAKSHEEKGVSINSGSNLNITSGGKTTLEGTQAKVGGEANIDAAGGVEKEKTESYGGKVAGGFALSGSGPSGNLDSLDANFEQESVNIQTGVKQ